MLVASFADFSAMTNHDCPLQHFVLDVGRQVCLHYLNHVDLVDVLCFLQFLDHLHAHLSYNRVVKGLFERFCKGVAGGVDALVLIRVLVQELIRYLGNEHLSN